jgi:hypothetical protein
MIPRYRALEKRDPLRSEVETTQQLLAGVVSFEAGECSAQISYEDRRFACNTAHVTGQNGAPLRRYFSSGEVRNAHGRHSSAARTTVSS